MIPPGLAIGIVSKFSGVAGKAIVVLALVAFILFSVRGVYKNGEAAERTRWELEIARANIELMKKVDTARAAGRAEGLVATRQAEKRAIGAETALERARNEDTRFDEALRTDWPDDWFISMCDQRSDCIPEN